MFPFQDLECPFKHENIDVLTLLAPMDPKDYPSVCTCGAALSYTANCIQVIHTPTPPGNYGSMVVSEVKCEAVSLDYLTDHLPAPKKMHSFGDYSDEDKRTKKLWEDLLGKMDVQDLAKDAIEALQPPPFIPIKFSDMKNLRLGPPTSYDPLKTFTLPPRARPMPSTEENHRHSCPDPNAQEGQVCICSCGFDLGPHHVSAPHVNQDPVIFKENSAQEKYKKVKIVVTLDTEDGVVLNEQVFDFEGKETLEFRLSHERVGCEPVYGDPTDPGKRTGMKQTGPTVFTITVKDSKNTGKVFPV